MTLRTNKRSPPRNPFLVEPCTNLYDMYVSLGRYNFVAKVINNGHMKVRNSLVWK